MHPITPTVVASLLAACSESGGVTTLDATVGYDVPFDRMGSEPRVGDEPPQEFGPWPGMLRDVIRTGEVFSSPRSDVIETPRCVPGTTARCVCDDLREGLQGCFPEGAYRDCMCPLPVPPPAVPPPPRLLRPLSGLRVTSQRPTLRWVLPEGVRRARVEVCADRPCTRTIERGEVEGSAWRPTMRLPPGVAFWRVQGLGATGSVVWTSATWEFGVRHSDAPVDTAYGSLKDYNGDGYDDLVAVRGDFPERESGSRGEGRPVVYHGSRVGVATEPSARFSERFCGLNSFNIDEKFRVFLASGDINGDGRADLVLADGLGADPCGYGETVLIHMGSREGLSNLPVRIDRPGEPLEFLEFGGSVGVGDVNGDGYGDVVVTARGSLPQTVQVLLYPGSASGVVAGRTGPGSRVSWGRDVPTGYYGGGEFPYGMAIGDVDGDGYGDVVVRAHETMVVVYGDAGGTLRRVGRVAPDQFRMPNNCRTMDLDLDGRSDVVGGSPTTWWANAGDGLVQAYRRFDPYAASQRGAMIWSGETGQPGDGDGDGLVEVVVRDFCPDDSTECRDGNISLYARRSTNEGIGVPRNLRTATYRTRAAFVGDLNGDGADDLVMADGSDLGVHALTGGTVRRTQTLAGDAVIRIE